MKEEQLMEKTKEAICCLYQNREHEAIAHVAELLPLYQRQIQDLLTEGENEQAIVLLNAVKELVENYQAQDMLGMADCLEGRIRKKRNIALSEASDVSAGECVAVQQAENGDNILIKYRNGRAWALNSRINPTEAAKYYARRYDIRPYTTYYVFGLSDGRCLREMLLKSDETNRFIVCEPDVETYNLCNALYGISDMLESRNVSLYIPEVTEAIEDILGNTLEYVDIRRAEFCILPDYDILYGEECNQFMDRIIDKNVGEVVKKDTCLKNTRNLPRNTLGNMKHMIGEKNIAQLRQKLEGKITEGMPAFIVSAGPSLDKNIQELKKVEGKALIIVVDAALRTVINAGIKPDIVCTVDPNVPERFFEHMDLSEVNWCCNNWSRVIEFEQRCKNIYYFGIFSRDWNRILSEELGYEFPNMYVGSNVTSVAYALATYLGFRTLVLVGQDMAFTNGKSHTSGAEEALGGKEYLKGRMLVKVEGVNGEVLDTDFQMWYYKKWFEKSIQVNNGVLEVINATEGGARIEGAENRKLCDVIATRCQFELNFRALEKDISPAFSMEQRERLYQKYKAIEKEVLALKEYISQTLKFQKELEKKQKSASVTETKEWLEQMVQMNNEIENMPWFDLMCLYAQKEEYEMSDRLCETDEPSVEELIQNSMILYQGYEKAVDMFLEDIRMRL